MERRKFLKLSAVAAAALHATIQGVSQENRNADVGSVKEALIILEKKAWQAWRDRDTVFLLKFFGQDSIIVGPAGVFGKEDIKKLADTDGPRLDYLLDNFQIAHLNDTTALLTFIALQNLGEVDSKLSPTRASTLYIKRNNKWEAAFHQQSAAC